MRIICMHIVCKKLQEPFIQKQKMGWFPNFAHLIANAEMMITRIPTPMIAMGRIPASENEDVACVSSAMMVVFHVAGSARLVVVFDIEPTTIAVMYRAIITAASVTTIPTAPSIAVESISGVSTVESAYILTPFRPNFAPSATAR